jgi:AcrR family transcriptional regulator
MTGTAGLGDLHEEVADAAALLEALLGQRFDRLAAKAESPEASRPPEDALLEWLSDFAAGAAAYRGLAASMMATLSDESSSLHASCLAIRQAAARLLKNAQDAGHIRSDADGTDLFALVSAVSWIADQAPSIAVRRQHLLSLIVDGVKYQPTS